MKAYARKTDEGYQVIVVGDVVFPQVYDIVNSMPVFNLVDDGRNIDLGIKDRVFSSHNTIPNLDDYVVRDWKYCTIVKINEIGGDDEIG